MKKMYHLFKYVMVLTFLLSVAPSKSFGQTKMHSYTFEDGTADDGTGSADGVLAGDAYVSDGALTLSGDGFVSFVGQEINISSYESITVEALFKQAPGVDGFTVLYGFGAINPEADWMGINYFIYQPTRDDNDFSRFSISCLNTDNPWTTETGINADRIGDTTMHYVVTVLTATEMLLYQDGALLGTEPLTGDNFIPNLSNDTVFIGHSPYPGDNLWTGSVYEMNIYEGVMDAASIIDRAEDLLGVPVTDATLKGISANKGDMSPEFDPETDMYELYVEYGTSQVILDAEPSVLGATVAMSGAGNEFTDGIVDFTGDGIDVNIEVTALNGITKKTYYVSVFLYPEEETASLTAINLSEGELTTEFNMDSTSYVAIVPYGTTSVNVTGVPAWSGASVAGNGTVVLTDGRGTATLTVISENGMNVKEYTVDIGATSVTTGVDYYIVQEASDLVIGESQEAYNVIKLYNPVYNESTQIFRFEASGVEGKYFLKNLVPSYLTLSSTSDWDMIMVDELTNNLDSCRFIPHEFEPGRFRIETVAKSESAQKFMGSNAPSAGEWVFSDKYIDNNLAIWHILPTDEVVDPYDTYLSELTIDQGSLSPAFDRFVEDYYVTLPVGTTSVNVTATVNDASSTVSGTGVFDVTGGPGEITLTVTASNPGYTRDYVIHYQEDTPLTLMHSYTFEDGTAQDQVGNADGIVAGGEITGGIYTASVADEDYITLPPEELALYTYPSMTMEAYVLTGENPGWTMTAYFGGLEGSNVLFMSLAGQTDLSRMVINEGLGESAASGTEPGTGELHHYVSTLTNDTITWHIDGAQVASIAINEAYTIHNISTENAWLCKSGYAADPTWLGSLYEFNIYSGVMDPDTIAARAGLFPAEDTINDATLSDLLVDGVTIEGFAPTVLEYKVILPNEVTDVPAVTATPRYSNASVDITPATELPGTTMVVVTAADGLTTNTYSIFFKNVGSNDATLSDLTLDGTTIDGFAPEKAGYVVIMPQSSSSVPIVDATANDPNATMEITQADGFPGLARVVVTAEDGVTVKNHVVNFTFISSTESLDETTLQVYPTLFNNRFKVKSAGESFNISVYDITGMLILEKKDIVGETDVYIAKPGMYFVKVDSEGVSNTFKVIKIK